MQIDKITDEQRAKMADWAQMWIDKVRYEKTDWAHWEASVKACYGFADIPWPDKVIIAPSPKAASLVVRALNTDKYREHVLASDFPLAFVAGLEETGLSGKIDGYNGGCYWSSWCAESSLYVEVLGVKLKTADRELAYRGAQTAGPWWPRTDCVVVSEKHTYLHPRRKTGQGQRQDHREDGPVIEWSDGNAAYALEGVDVPKHFVMSPETITLDEVRGKQNAEVRRIAMQRFGIARYLQAMGAQPIDRDAQSALYKLGEDGCILICTDGSTGKMYELTVSDDCQTCAEAQAVLGGVDPEKMLERS